MYADFKMTYNQGLTIQRALLAYHRQALGLRGIRKIRRATRPCPLGLHPDEPTSVLEINGLIPRGGDIEYVAKLCQGPIRNGNRIEYDPELMRINRRQVEPCSLRGAIHDAIRRGLM